MARESHQFVRRSILQFIFALVIAAAMVSCVAAGTFVTYLLWQLLTHGQSQEVSDAPAWLIIPSFALGMALFYVVNHCARLIERLLKLLKTTDRAP